MVKLTENAAKAIQSAIAGAPSSIAGLRVTVQPGGCSGYVYEMGLVENAVPGDMSIESGGLTIYVDAASVAMISGTMIDFVDDPSGSGFAFDNPQAKSKCGCGKSFC